MTRAERAATAVAGLAALALGLWALLIPAVAILYVTDGYHFADPVSQVIGFTAVLVLTAMVATVLLLAAALLRAAIAGAWPPWRRLFLGRFGAAGVALVAAVVVVLALVI